jgi:hypothetical protein
MTGASLPVSVVLVLSFATLVAAHLALAYGLVRSPRHAWKGILALIPLFAPLAAYWGYRERLRVRVWIWGVSLAVYLTALSLSFVR